MYGDMAVVARELEERCREVETLDFEHMLTVVQDAYTACKLVVDGKLDPEWLPGGNPAEK